MDSKKYANNVVEKKNSIKLIFYSYLQFLFKGGEMAFNVCKWTIYHFGMHGIILLGIIKF